MFCIRSRSNRLLLSASRFCAYYHPVAQYVCERTARIRPSDGLAHTTSFDLGWRSIRFRDFPVFRPCVTPALATSTLTRVARFQITYTRRIASLMPAFPTATVKATVDPRTSSQRIPSRIRYTDRPCPAHVAITVQIRSLQRRRFATRSLCDVPINHDETDSLLRQVVGRLHSRRRHEGEDTPRRARGNAWPCSGHAASSARRADPHARPPRVPACSCRSKCKRRQLLPLMKHCKQLLQRLPQSLPITPIARIRQRRQKLHIADQMRQTKLQATPRTPSCNADTPRNNRSPSRRQNLAPKQVHQHVGTACWHRS